MSTVLTVALTLLAVAAVFGLRRRIASFMAQRPEDYATGPVFDIRERLNGPILCEGVIYGPLGRVSSRFVAHFDAVWQGDVCVIKEQFEYDSGAVQDRQWTFRLRPDGSFAAEASDLVGPGTGRQKGSAVQLIYRIRMTEDAGGHVLDVTDWMYLTANGSILNRSQFRKFGIKVAELVATMRPKNAA